MRRFDRGEALLKAAADQLNDLPSGVDTELRPPMVVLDSTKSSDGQDVFAILSANPALPEGPINIVTVPQNNARFRNNGIRPGDIVKYYSQVDATVDKESRLSGFVRRIAMDLTVAQVIDDQTLLVEGGLDAESDVEVVLVEAIDQLGDQGEVAEVTAGHAYRELIPRGLAAPLPQKLEVWRFRDDRLPEINRQLRLYRDRRLPPQGWEPSPDGKVLVQVVALFNQWLRQSEPKSNWQVDPLLESLDARLKSNEALAPHISPPALARLSFEPHEGRLLQEAAWMRDISRWARGEGFDNVERATALFDWTTRNVQLVSDDAARPHRPWQVLLYGRGTAEQRAWVFALLCRQLGLDVVMLAIPNAAPHDDDSSDRQASAGEASNGGASIAAGATFWLPALLENDELFLFDTRLGLPVPGPGGQGVATLDQVRQDDALLRQLDLEGAPYAATDDALEEVVAYIPADPFDLTRRARLVDSSLTGDDRLALTVAPSPLAARLKELPPIQKVYLWPLPFETLRDQLTLENTSRNRARLIEVLAFEPFAVRPVLWKARTRHFQGRDQADEQDTSTSLEEPINDHGEAARLYTSKSVRPSDRDIEKVSDDRRRVDIAAKLYATYWVGLLSYDNARYDVAAHWFSRPELQDSASPLSAGARYNLARSHEALGNVEEVIELLESDDSPQKHGNRLRAKRLRARSNASADESQESATGR